MKKVVMALMTFVLLTFSFACIDSGFNVIVTQDDLEQAIATDGVVLKQIIINKGDTFRVTLYAHLGAGDRWSIGNYDRSIIEFDYPQELIPDNTGGFGGPGKEVWTFKALNEGVTTITMFKGSLADLPDTALNMNTLELTVEVKR